MIAIVPDPIQTHMALRFDRAIDAIELAAESMNYGIDRYWLPWDTEPKTDWFDYDSFKEARIDRDQQEALPGVLLFRWDEKPEKTKADVLYVFLVGETTTAGVNGAQFANAVSYADLLNAIPLKPSKRHPATSKPPPRSKAVPTYVLGPTSSSSFESLVRLMRKYDPNKFVIHSTARNQSALEPNPAQVRQFSPFIGPVPEATHALERTLAVDRDIDDIEKKPCPDEGGRQVAMLSETSTTLGKLDDKDLCVDVFRYPREIAALRNAYGASSAQNPASGDKSAGPRPSLSVNLTDLTNRGDEPPDFSKAQSPLSMEAALMAFAAEMRRKHYKYIGINGSNPLDIVFLIGFLRSAVPNARLFSFESDLLMQHEPDNVPYIGTLSVTTYPLLFRPLNRIGEPSLLAKRTRLPFTSQREEGIYNATVCMLGEMLQDENSGVASLLERTQCSEQKPLLWLTTFGAGGRWPVEVLGAPEDLKQAPAPALEILPLPPSWEAICTLMCAHAGLHVLVLLGLAPFSAKFQGFKLGTVAPVRQLLGIHVASATLALALVMVGSSAWKPNPWTIASRFFVVILPAVCGLITFKYFRWWQKDRSHAADGPGLFSHLSPSGMAWQISAFCAIWAAAVVLAYMWRTLLHNTLGYYGAFFQFRALHLGSVVSPLTPMLPLLAAIYVAAIFYVWHLVFEDTIRPRLNPSGEEPPGEDKLRPGWRSEKFIAKAINKDAQNAFIGVIILIVWFFVFFRSQFELFERSQFQTLYQILFCVVVLLILVSGFRLALIWEKLRRFLLELNRQRARRVFLQLKGEGWPSLWFYGSEDPDWDYMVRSLEPLQELWHTLDKPAGAEEVDKAIKEIRCIKRELQKQEEGFLVFLRTLHSIRVGENDGRLEKAISHAQGLLAATLNDVLDRLQALWGRHLSDPEVIERQKPLEKYAALRWVAFIRSVIGRIRLLIIFLAISFSLAMVSLVVYSFEPHQELLWSVTALFIAIGLLIVTVLIQMHQDPILSRITDTKPGRLDLTFYVRLVVLGLGPVLTLLATHFPSIGRYAVSFLQPGLEAMK